MDFEKMYYLLKNEIVRKTELVKNLGTDNDFNRGHFCACAELLLFSDSLER